MLYSFKGAIKGIRRSRLGSTHLNQVNARLLCCSGKLPSEFNRQPRSLDDLDYWKATELRSFLLYTGVVALKDIVTDEIYQHFICLNIAVSLLCCTDDDQRNGSLGYCRELLKYFVDNAHRLYERPFVSYNIHSLQHIPDDVKHFNAPLSSIDAFSFENKLKTLKSMVKGNTNPIAQVFRKNQEVTRVTPSWKSQGFKVSTRCKDYCFESEKYILLVKDIHGNTLSCNAYKKDYLDSVYRHPDESKEHGVFYIPRRTRYTLMELPRENLRFKCVNLPYKEGIAVIPMVHL